jgi:fibronectin-binding autotransporter adhesin
MSPLLRFCRNIRQARSPRHMPGSRRPTARLRLQLEPLEDRLVPTNLTWTGANSELWSDPRNWLQGKTPYMTPEPDALVFDEHAARKVSNHDGPATTIESITFYDSGFTIQGGDLTLDHFGIHSFVVYNRRGTNTVENRTISMSEESLELKTTFAHEELVVRSNITGGSVFLNLDFQGFGDGRLVLLGNNSYTGGTNLLGGTLVVGNNSALGSGRLDFGGGTLEASASVTLPNPMSVVGPECSIGGNNRLNFSGSAEIRGLLTIANTSGPVRFTGELTGTGTAGIVIEQDATVTVANASGVISDFSGYIYGPGSLRKEGNGQLKMGGVGHYTGGTEIAAGELLVTNDRALGGGTVTLSGGTLAKGATSAVTLDNSFVNTGGTIRNFGQFPFTFTGRGTLIPGLNRALRVFNDVGQGDGYPAEIIFTGGLSGAGRLTVTGGGITTFSGTAANDYTGITTIEQGVLVLKKPSGVTAIAGPLVVGGVNGVDAVVSLGAPNQINDDSAVTLNVTGLLAMNDFDDFFGSLDGDGQLQTDDPPTLTVGFNNHSTTFGGVISGPGAVVKVGNGAWTLTGANTYTGGTVVNGGELLVNGSLTGPVTVSAGATLGGAGGTGPVTLSAGATVNPGGAAPGTLKVQDLAFSPGSLDVVQLNGSDAGIDYDLLDVTGAVSLGEATLDASLGFVPEGGQSFVIINNDGVDPISGAFAGLPQGAALWIGDVGFHIYYDGGDGNDVELVRNVPPTVTAPGDQTAFQNVDLAIGGISVGDPDDANLTVTLQVSHGTLTLATVAGLTVAGNGTSTVSLSGSQAALNAALASPIYRDVLNFSRLDVMTVTASDGLDVTSASVAIRVKSLGEQAAGLQGQVAALQSTGVLNKGQANSLIVKLNLKDNHGDIGRVRAFLFEVDALLSAGVLSPAQADSLLGPGNILLTGLSRR